MTLESKYGSWNVDGALQMARELLERSGCTLPVDITKLACNLGVVQVEPAEMSIDGYLGRGSDGQLLIRYKSSSPRVRSRFTIAHELGHILLYRASQLDVPRSATRSRNRCSDEEYAANRVASELLMPREVIIPRLANGNLSWAQVRELSREFDVSITALARRVLEVSQRPIVIFWATASEKERSVVRNCRCSISVSHEVLFSQPPKREAQHLVDSLAGAELYHPRAFIDGHECLLQWDVMQVERYCETQHWFLCRELTRR